VYKVNVVTESEGYWIVEALEDSEDCIEGEKVPVKTVEKRIVQPNDLVKRDVIPPIVTEHTYELQLEKKAKQMVKKYEKDKAKE
jgi:hypothetical protein